MGVTNHNYPYVADEDWHWIGDVGEPAFENSWINYGTGYTDAAFRRDADGWVYLRGMPRNGTSNTTAFTLPAGYRPLYTVYIPSVGGNSSDYWKINTDGQVQINGSTTWNACNNARFPVWGTQPEFADFKLFSHVDLQSRVNDTELPFGFVRRSTGMVNYLGITGAVANGTVAPIYDPPQYSYMSAATDSTSDFIRVDISTRYGMWTGSAASGYCIFNGEYGTFEIEDRWIDMSLENSWVDFGFDANNKHAPASYYKDHHGIVHLRGLVKSGSSASAVMETLPAGYRPDDRLIMPSVASTGTCRIDVKADGEVYAANGGSTAWTSLSGISFYADQ